MPFVLDSSVALTWILPDERREEVDLLCDRLATESAVVPPVWPLEVGNVLLVAVRRGRITQNEMDEALGYLRALPVEVDTSSWEEALKECLVMAAKFGLTTYDASYVELARRRGLPLASLDRRLREACGTAGVEVLP
jgi:predicted nucleic acid-binding protein